jgi:hypothetical protein
MEEVVAVPIIMQIPDVEEEEALFFAFHKDILQY